ncbi:alkaline phosphatase family protein [bacterium]|nr:alkaline phosphatase family protein [candidate division CSSED10-310 bacterium]
MRKLDRIHVLLWSIYGLISIVYLFAGSIHLDEGAYMYAANAVFDGKLLYRDFFFLQPPLQPIVYGFVQFFCHGLLAGRLTSILLGCFTTIILIRLSERLSPGNRSSSRIFLALMVMSPFQLYFFSITRLYALTAFFIAAGCYFLFRNNRPDRMDSLAGMVLLALALGTRLTVLPLVFFAGVYVLLTARNHVTKILSLTAAGVTLAAVYTPCILIAGIDRLGFNLLGMNLSLHSNNLSANLIQKARATVQLLQFYFFAWLMFLPIAVDAIRVLFHRPARQWLHSFKQPRIALWILTLSTLSVHTIAKLYQVSYQTIIMPVFFVLLANEWSRKMSTLPRDSRRIATIAFSVFVFVGILAYGRTSLSIIDGKPALLALWEQADFIRNHTSLGDRVFSADSPLAATEARRDILPGMASSDLFAGWSTEQCRQFNVLNFEILREYVSNQSAALLIAGDLSFNLSLPFLEPVPASEREALWNLIHSKYTQVNTFPNIMLPGTSTHYFVPRDASESTPSKLLLFGIDAAAWNVVKPLCDQGFLPHIQAALTTGYAADMETLDPTVSVMLWTTIATGMLPENHGINNWLSEGMDTSGQLAITSDRRKVPAFWNTMSTRRILLANWWATWPVEPIPGVMISNRTHFRDLPHTVYPPEEADFIRGISMISRSELEAELTRWNPEGRPIRLPEFFSQQLIKDHFYLDATHRMLLQSSFDLVAVFVRGVDILEHEFLRDVHRDDMAIPVVPENQHGIVKAYYRYLDHWLGTLQTVMGPDTGVLIVSDHGMDPVTELPPLIEGLDINKLLKKLENESNGRMSTADFADNHRYPPGLQRGLAWIGSDHPTDTRIDEMMQALSDLMCDGRTVFHSITRGPDTGEVIHCVLDPNPGFKSVIRWHTRDIPLMSVTSMIIHPRSGQHWHAPDGLFLVSGPGIRKTEQQGRIRIQDIMPTMMHWMNHPIAKNLDGRVHDEIFTEGFMKSHPITWVETYGTRSTVEPVAAPASVEASIRDELESLGYIQVSTP